MNNFTSVYVTLPDDLDQQIEACLDGLRAQFVDPTDKKDPGLMVRIAIGSFSELLAKLYPTAMELAEPGILLQSVALSSVIYFTSNVTPGEWVRETGEDFKRAFTAITMLMKLGDAHDALQRDADAKAAEASKLVIGVDMAKPGTDETVIVPAGDVVPASDDPNAAH